MAIPATSSSARASHSPVLIAKQGALSPKDQQALRDFGSKPISQRVEPAPTGAAAAAPTAMGIFQVLGLPHLHTPCRMSRRWSEADWECVALDVSPKKIPLKWAVSTATMGSVSTTDQTKTDAEKPEDSASSPPMIVRVIPDNVVLKGIDTWLARFRPANLSLMTQCLFEAEREEVEQIAKNHVQTKQLFMNACKETIRLSAQAAGSTPETFGSTPYNCFNIKNIFEISMEDYIERIDRYCFGGPDENVYLKALFYIDRLLCAQKMPLTLYNVHRVALTALRLANKSVHDAYYKPKFWNSVGGVNDIEALEWMFVEIISWEIDVSHAQMQRAKVDLLAKLEVPQEPPEKKART